MVYLWFTKQGKMLTLRKVNKEIGQHFQDVEIRKGKGYYYITSKDNERSLQIFSLKQTAIYVNSLNQLSLGQWIDAVKELIYGK